MIFSEGIFVTIQENNCPLYRVGDKFNLSGKSLIIPDGKPVCLTLSMDLSKIVEDIEEREDSSPIPKSFTCSGCQGTISLTLQTRKGEAEEEATIKREKDISSIANALGQFSFFSKLDESSLKDLIAFLGREQYVKGQPIIKKGQPGKHLYIIVSGKVDVLDEENGIHFATLGKGEIFGEMSLLSGNPVSATVKATETVKVLYLNGEYFRRVLCKFAPVQMYFAKLFAKRLAKTNTLIYEDFSKGVSGKISELPPADLFQLFHVNQKTGVIKIELPYQSAEVCFREGELIQVSCGKISGRYAFWQLLKEKQGRFRYIPELDKDIEQDKELQDFMSLLMEGIRRMEDDQSFLKTSL